MPFPNFDSILGGRRLWVFFENYFIPAYYFEFGLSMGFCFLRKLYNFKSQAFKKQVKTKNIRCIILSLKIRGGTSMKLEVFVRVNENESISILKKLFCNLKNTMDFNKSSVDNHSHERNYPTKKSISIAPTCMHV